MPIARPRLLLSAALRGAPAAWLVLALASPIVGCDTGARLGALWRGLDERSDPQPIVAAATALVPGIDRLRRPGEFVLDLRADGALLLAEVDPAPPDSDGGRRLRVRAVGGRGAPKALADAGLLEDARYLPGTSALLAITVDHRLLLLDDAKGAPEVLARDAHGPLSIAPGGHFAALLRGAMPDLAPARLALARSTRSIETLDPALAPCWGVLVDDDGSLRFVAGRAGVRGGKPAWHRTGPAGSVGALLATPLVAAPSGGPFADGPTAPLRALRSVLFENEAGLHIVDDDGRSLGAPVSAFLPVALPGQAALLVHAARDGGALRVLDVRALEQAAAAGEPVR
ncbi:MAG: hypothetical protein EXR72_12495 [Myxococcales bacterium]|nr:hypothetical protein [Myxococcales bacterium]